MAVNMRWVLVAGVWVAWSNAHAQIYTCTAEDGTRIFSDERCGPDAKIVPGISTKKRSTTGGATAKRAPKTPAELEELLAQCNAGEMKACTEWTHGGGPNRLREQEQKTGLACEGGSLRDCELRYCMDGMTSECRTRVLQAAKVSGETWYLREQRPQTDGATAYDFRCATQDERTIRESTVSCSGPPGPERCVLSSTQQGFARLDLAAASYCD